MKKILLSTILFIMIFSVFAQKLTEVKPSELPKPVEKYIKDNLPGARIFKAVKIEDKGTLKYNVAVDLKGKKQVYVFDRNGKFLKKGEDVTAPSNKVIINKGNEKGKTQPQGDSAQKIKSSGQEKQEMYLVIENSRDSIRNRP